MKKTIILFSWLSILISVTNAQDDNDFPAPSQAEVPGAKFLQQKYFDGNALWGHIDGGADLYLEYGFDKLLFQEFDWHNIKLRVEYYRMKDSDAAFGIFSVSRFKCNIKDSLTTFSCITPYQVQCALGRFYISITNDKGSLTAQSLSLKLFQMILAKSKDKLFKLPGQFNSPVYAKYTDEIKLFRGTLGLQNGFPSWIDLFERFSGYEITLLPIEDGEGYLYFATVNFDTEKDKVKFIKSIGINPEPGRLLFKVQKNNKTHIVKLISDREIYFYETNFNNDRLKEYPIE